MIDYTKTDCKNCMYHKFFKKNEDGTIDYYCPYDECVKDERHTYAEVSEVTHRITTKEFLDACKVINTYCKEQHCQCATCPMLGVCRVGVPSVNPTYEEEEADDDK